MADFGRFLIVALLLPTLVWPYDPPQLGQDAMSQPMMGQSRPQGIRMQPMGMGGGLGMGMMGMGMYGTEGGNRSSLLEYGVRDFVPLEKPIDAKTYILGPGDVLTLNIWGKTSITHDLIVEPEGKIFIPKVGDFEVNGLTIEQTNKFINKALNERYLGIFYRLSLFKPRTFNVFVLGEVTYPGVYQAIAVERASEVIFKAGNVTKAGTKSYISLRRGGKETVMDQFAYERYGDLEQNPYMREGDVIYVPLAKRQITVVGEIKRSGVFELLEGEDLKQLLARLGGPTPKAALDEDIIINRYSDKGDKSLVLYVNFTKMQQDKDFRFDLQDGDEIKMRSISEAAGKIFITGAFGASSSASGVGYAGDETTMVEYRENNKLMEVITKVGGVTPLADMANAVLHRKKEKETEVINLHLYELLVQKNMDYNITLLPEDRIYIPNMAFQIHTAGEVKIPKTFLFSKNRTVYDYINEAGGVTTAGDRDDIIIIKKNGEELDYETGYALAPGDTIYLPEVKVKFWRDYLAITTGVTSLVFALMAAFRR